ncbi:hypothetical protein CONPUDRAFT_157290 [Coniophora puteana RWD-64-598 SS2]|uniref:CENP-V/GFA domain-containing protein n=1 Tax=Coniophora puteana (strain RWD-64-598) TaxID=741705 RepID=A0A5M3MCS8_CONPW|nr:uncharacterized protein CONPUDRAFT_157290 [Coniophora puteana RWD-64-598 SS2]EIW77018.1 hypothetical protein CONPUDRAFT_157290 [Coniophora puteana RWD-64-598 SS2]
MATHTQGEEKRKVRGSCLCKTVRYELNADADMVWYNICHCIDCRKASGSAFSLDICFSETRSEYKITQGEDALGCWIERNTVSGNPVSRYFCTKCGSLVKLGNPLKPDRHDQSGGGHTPEERERLDRVFVAAGTLDDPVTWVPSQEVFCKDRLPWLQESGLDVPQLHME